MGYCGPGLAERLVRRQRRLLARGRDTEETQVGKRAAGTELRPTFKLLRDIRSYQRGVKDPVELRSTEFSEGVL